MRFPRFFKVGFDLETTGVNPLEARIVTASIVIRNRRQHKTISWLVNPQIEIPDEAAAVHGISTEKARKDGRHPKETLEEIAGLLADNLSRNIPVVAFNLSYDWTVLDSELKRWNLRTINERVGHQVYGLIDPYVIDKEVDKYRKGSRKLNAVAEHYGITEIENWHDSDADALAAVLITEKLFDKYPYLSAMGAEKLYGSQQMWRSRQCASLQEYFRNPVKSGDKHNPEAIVIGDWPIIADQVSWEAQS